MSLYLKYRPSDFNNLVWQSFIKETLQSSIKNNKTVWAYLFCWPRWTGKTSSARIFAKAMNCLNPINWNPCLECSICKDFADNNLTDIIEMDAASVTWVDNIRGIIEKAQFTPNKTKYKIYIIDEVHMLSPWAFNALLKILEEPPSHVKFILATTETHKVPDTIISRCQRYDFRNISNEDIKNRLNYIAKNESITIDEKSINYIIKNSAGALRNAISLFEQLISDFEISYDNIVKKLEIVDENIIDSFLEKLINKDSNVIDIFDKIINNWKNIKLFFKELIFYTKNRSLNELRLKNDITRYVEILDILDETYTKTKHSLDENTTFLIGILKIINRNNKNIIIEDTAKDTKTTLKIKENFVINNKEQKDDIQISHDDVFDIFWKNTVENKTKEVDKEISTKTNFISFDSEKLIEKMKTNWAKWWLTMAVRWANPSLDWNKLIIWVHNKIHKWQVENIDNINIIKKSLNEMWVENPIIIIN